MGLKSGEKIFQSSLRSKSISSRFGSEIHGRLINPVGMKCL